MAGLKWASARQLWLFHDVSRAKNPLLTHGAKGKMPLKAKKSGGTERAD